MLLPIATGRARDEGRSNSRRDPHSQARSAEMADADRHLGGGKFREPLPGSDLVHLESPHAGHDDGPGKPAALRAGAYARADGAPFDQADRKGDLSRRLLSY